MFADFFIFHTLNSDSLFLFNYEDKNPRIGGIFMTNEQKRTIALLRFKGVTYAKIGETRGISKDTVKSYCRRNNLSAPQVAPVSDTGSSVCRECGAPLVQPEKQRVSPEIHVI